MPKSKMNELPNLPVSGAPLPKQSDLGSLRDMRALRQKLRHDSLVYGFSSIAQVTDRIISGMPVAVQVIDPNDSYWSQFGLAQYPAWSNGETVFINRDKIVALWQNPKALPEDIVITFFGTNYHELSHVIFTPRNGSPYKAELKSRVEGGGGNAFHMAWNMLEDQRIETLYTSLYPPVTYYFVASIAEWILGECTELERVYPLIYGRKFLDRNIRHAARQSFIKAHKAAGWVDEMERIIDDFILTPSDAYLVSLDLVQEFIDLMRANKVWPDEKTCSQLVLLHDNNQQGTPDLKALQEAVDKADEIIIYEKSNPLEDDPEEAEEKIDFTGKKVTRISLDDDSEDDFEDDDGDFDEDDEDFDSGDRREPGRSSTNRDDSDDSDDSDDEDSGNESDAQAPNKSQSDDEDAAEDVAEDFDEDYDSPSSGHGSDLSNKPMPSLEDQLQDMVEDELARTLASPEFAKDIKQTATAVKVKMEDYAGTHLPKYNGYDEGNAPSGARRTANGIVQQLRRMQLDLEPGWLRDQPNGKLSIPRVIRREADPTLEDIYDRWDEGTEDEGTIEVVIIFDLSMSMSEIMSQCSESLWSLKYALQQLSIPVTVIGFSTDTAMMYDTNEKVTVGGYRRFRPWGGTDATQACKWALAKLQKSDAAHTIFIGCTDGAWEVPEEAEAAISMMRRKGTHTALFTFELPEDSQYRGSNWDNDNPSHNCEVAVTITDPQDVVKVIEAMVQTILAKAGSRS